MSATKGLREELNMFSEEELDAELRQERMREHLAESNSSHFDDWLSDNLNDLQSAFIEESQSDAFYEYVKEVYNAEREDR
jgi:hypothetical protein